MFVCELRSYGYLNRLKRLLFEPNHSTVARHRLFNPSATTAIAKPLPLFEDAICMSAVLLVLLSLLCS